MSAAQSPSGVKNNVLPDVTLSERTTGVTRHRCPSLFESS